MSHLTLDVNMATQLCTAKVDREVKGKIGCMIEFYTLLFIMIRR